MRLLRKNLLLLSVLLASSLWPGTAVAEDPSASKLANAFFLRGQQLIMWSEPDGTRLLIYRDNFSIQGPAQKLSSDRAVIWLTQHLDRTGRIRNNLRLYLEGNVQATDANAATIADQILLTSLEAPGGLIIEATLRTDDAKRDDPLYQRAIATLHESQEQQFPQVSNPQTATRSASYHSVSIRRTSSSPRNVRRAGWDTQNWVRSAPSRVFGPFRGRPYHS